MYLPRKKNKYSRAALSKQEPSLVDKIKDLDIVIYSSPLCFYCIRLKQMLSDGTNLLQYMNVIEDQKNFPKDISGLPFIVSKKTKKTIEGAPNTIEDFINQITKKN